MDKTRCRWAGLWALVFSITCGACGPQSPRTQVSSPDGRSVELEGIANCEQNPQGSVQLDGRPLTVIVHGSFSDGSRFASLSKSLESKGQQALCYNYDDREALTTSAARLRRHLVELSRRHPAEAPITVLGHSQGGLVGRLAVSDRIDLPLPTGRLQLVTASAPLNGIRAAEHCGLVGLHVTSLGMTMGICQAITGSKWPQIHERSRLVVDPPRLLPAVERHVALVTDERAACERFDEKGRCVEDDYVFSVDEQLNPRLVVDPRVTYERVTAGHGEIVGESKDSAPKLFAALAKHDVFAPSSSPMNDSSAEERHAATPAFGPPAGSSSTGGPSVNRHVPEVTLSAGWLDAAKQLLGAPARASQSASAVLPD